jgi:putative transcriptional regulator
MGKKLSKKELDELEESRNVWQEVLESIEEIRQGGGKRSHVVPAPNVVEIRLKSGLTQVQFASILGVSKRTLEQWEQGRREPSGAALSLLKIADKHPEVLVELAA